MKAGRGTGIAVPPGVTPGQGRGTGIAIPPGASPAGRGGGVAMPGAAAPAKAVPPPLKAVPPPLAKAPPPAAPVGAAKTPTPPTPLSPTGASKTAPPIAARAAPPPPGQAAAPAPQPAKANAAPPQPAKPNAAPSGTKMPRLPLPAGLQGTVRGVDQTDARLNEQKVKRAHIPRHADRKWSTVVSMMYPYDKIKSEFAIEGLFTRMKSKCWMVVYYDMVLMYLPTKEGPPSMDDKHEGRPFDYFFIDNIIDSDKIQSDEAKLTIDLPTAVKGDNLRVVCDTPQQFKDWRDTLVTLAKVFETTSREGMDSPEEVARRVEEIKKVLPVGVEPMGATDNVEHNRAVEWFGEMKRLYEAHRKYLPYVARIERFSAYRIGATGVYCNFFQGRDRDGPLELLEKTKKKVFTYWEAEVERIIKLCEAVLADAFIDRDHLPFHREDCQIGAYLIDAMNNYSTVVHGVAPQKLVLQKSLATLEELWGRLGQARTM